MGRKHPSGVVMALVLWLTLVCGATVLMSRYADTPGTATSAPDHWPKESRLPLEPKRPTLLMFVHPRCPCSRASLGELDRLLGEVSTLPNVTVVFVQPPGTQAGWAKAELWRTASAIRGVRTFLDERGVEARRFHAQTSGQTLLYDPDRRLRFQGGITLSRGHAGDNPGRTSLWELIEYGHSDQTQTPVYGCELLDEQTCTKNSSCKP